MSKILIDKEDYNDLVSYTSNIKYIKKLEKKYANSEFPDDLDLFYAIQTLFDKFMDMSRIPNVNKTFMKQLEDGLKILEMVGGKK